jgi:hypothetical protein
MRTCNFGDFCKYQSNEETPTSCLFNGFCDFQSSNIVNQDTVFSQENQEA